MTPIPNDYPAPTEHTSGATCVLLVIAWLWVGVPLGWGISRTVVQAIPLFKTAPQPTDSKGAPAKPPASPPPTKAAPDATKLEKAGARFDVREDAQSGDLTVTCTLEGADVTDATLIELARVRNLTLTTLILRNASVTNAGLREIAAFDRLSTLDLTST